MSLTPHYFSLDELNTHVYEHIERTTVLTIIRMKETISNPS